MIANVLIEKCIAKITQQWDGAVSSEHDWAEVGHVLYEGIL